MLQMVKEKVQPKSNANEKDAMKLMELGYIKWISLGICRFFYDISTNSQTNGEFNHDGFEDRDDELEVDEQDELPGFNLHGNHEMLEFQNNG